MTLAIRRISTQLVDFEIWAVGVLIAASVISTSLLPVAAGSALLFWVIRWISYGRLSLRTPIDLSIVLLGLAAIISLWITPVSEKTVPQVLRLLTGIAFFYAIVNWAINANRLRLLVLGLILSGLIIALIAPVSVTWYTSKLPFIPSALYDRFTLLVSDTVHPNTMGGNLVFLLPIPLALAIFHWRGMAMIKRLGLSLVLMLITLILFLTKSRGAWVGFAIVLISLILLRYSRAWILMLFLLAGFVIFTSIVGLRNIIEILTANDALGGISGRFEIWARSFSMIRDFPFTGIGMGSYVEVGDLFYPYLLIEPGKIVHSHNLFLQVAVDLGIPGLIAWLAIYFQIIHLAWQIYRQSWVLNDRWMAGLGAGLLGGQLALLVHGITDAVTWGMVRTAPLVWVLWGLTVAARCIQLKPIAREDQVIVSLSSIQTGDLKAREV